MLSWLLININTGRPYRTQSSSNEGTSDPGITNDVISCYGVYFKILLLSEPTLKELVQFLFPVASKWYYIGLWIGVDENELDKIEVDNSNESNMCLVKTLKRWLKMVQPKPLWSTVVDALKGVQEEKLAESICQKMLGHVTQTS